MHKMQDGEVVASPEGRLIGGIPPWGPPAGAGGALREAMTSSILRIMLATSSAELMAWTFTLRGSTTFLASMSTASPESRSIP